MWRQFELECRPFYVAGFNAHDLVPKSLANPAEHKTEGIPCPPAVHAFFSVSYATVEALVGLSQYGSASAIRMQPGLLECSVRQYRVACMLRRRCLGGQATRWALTWCATCLPMRQSGSSTPCACTRTPPTPTIPSWCAHVHPHSWA